MNWLIAANSKMYDHASSFAHYGSIDWRQGNTRYSLGDIVYIYCTSPIQKIRYKCRVTQINKRLSEIRDDREYWINLAEYEKALSGSFFNLQLIEEVDSDRLSLSELIKVGLKAAPQGPVKLSDEVEQYISKVFNTTNDEFFPEVLETNGEIYEGLKKQVSVNKYERSSLARSKCIEIHKCICKVCGFDFEKTYGSLGKDFIHIHHITPIHSVGKEYKIDYARDLVPVCPNCHAMLHRKINDEYYSVEKLRELVFSRR